MGLREAIQRVLTEYPTARAKDFAGNELADFLRRGFPETLRGMIAGFPDTEGSDLLVQGSAGQGQWVRCPWVGIFDPVVTDSAERGYYVVYLFREDFTGAYCSLNQGVTDVREQYKARVKDALRTRAADYRTRLGRDISPFISEEIELRPSASTNYSADYEAGNIVSKFYATGAIPDEKSLSDDVLAMLKLYETLAYSVGDGSTIEPEEQDNEFIENYAAFRLHRRIERNPLLVKKVKELHGFKCEACGFDFEKEYPGIEKNKYIEAHHLMPVSNLKGNKVSRNPMTDFAVLCPNCHRMIHRFSEPWNLVAFRQTLRQGGQAVGASS
jgi:5-methylcytosine-specific restriction enzyme A